MYTLGLTLGRGFQQQDDVLGIWGDPEATGKAAGNDIRRRKKSMPIVLLGEAALPDELERLGELYAHTEAHSERDLGDSEVAAIMELLTYHEVRDTMQAQVEEQHLRARSLLLDMPESAARAELLHLAEGLATRSA
jgi:geranylgeranyl diphosphate synthase type I